MSMPQKQQSLALHSIAILEISKGILALTAAAGFLSLKHTDLNVVAHTFLMRHGLDPGKHPAGMLIESVAKSTNHHSMQIAGLCLVYALVRFVEGYGLWRARYWAEWFAVLSTGVYLPLELRHFARHPSLPAASVILVNLAILGCLTFLLYQQRHHHTTTPLSPP